MEGIAAAMPHRLAPPSTLAVSSSPSGGRTADAGQGQEFARIFAENLGWAWSLVRRLGVAERDVEDVTHDAFVAVHRHLDRYDRGRPLRPWLYAFVVHAALAQKRRAHVRHERLAATDGDNAEGACEAPSPESQSAQKQAIAAALALLDRLPDERRAVFVLVELEGLSVPDVAECLEIPLNTAYSRLRLAREDVRNSRERASVSNRPLATEFP